MLSLFSAREKRGASVSHDGSPRNTLEFTTPWVQPMGREGAMTFIYPQPRDTGRVRS